MRKLEIPRDNNKPDSIDELIYTREGDMSIIAVCSNADVATELEEFSVTFKWIKLYKISSDVNKSLLSKINLNEILQIIMNADEIKNVKESNSTEYRSLSHNKYVIIEHREKGSITFLIRN